MSRKQSAKHAVLTAATAIGLLWLQPGTTADRPAAPATPRDVTVAVAGDLLGPFHPVLDLNDPQLAEIIRLIHSADVGFANQEGSIFDMADYRGYPAAENGGALPLAPRALAAEFKAMGITMMSKANNHATDWSVDGLGLTEQSLDGAGIVHAGSGTSEATARAPAFLSTPKGRFALVATASTYTKLSRAGEAGDYHGRPLRARPGISVVENQALVVADPAEMAALRAMAARRGSRASGDRVTLGEQTFTAGTSTKLHYTASASDIAAVIGAVHTAAQAGAFSIFSIHAHETASDDSEDSAPAEFLTPLFHQAIDAGASLVVRHGPHALKGIEVYNGRPIFYGMASLFFDFGPRGGLMLPNGQFAKFPSTWFESALALARYHDGALVDVKLYPLMLEISDRPSVGLPRIAHGADAKRILGRLQEESKQFGTHIELTGDIGIITVVKRL